MMLFQVSYERFLEEIKYENVFPGGKSQLECEDLGSLVAYYLYSLDRPVSFVFVIKKSEMTDVQKVNLSPISKQSIRIRDSVQLTAIADALNRIEQNTKNAPVAPGLPQPASLSTNLVKNPNRPEE